MSDGDYIPHTGIRLLVTKDSHVRPSFKISDLIRSSYKLQDVSMFNVLSPSDLTRREAKDSRMVTLGVSYIARPYVTFPWEC